MQQYRISAGQLIGMMFWTIMGTAIISLPVLIGLHAPRDAWAAAVLFTLGGIVLSLVVGALANRFPREDFVVYTQKVLGTFMGKLLILAFLVWLFHSMGFVLWQVTNFNNHSLLPDTPIVPIMAILLLPSAYAVHSGIEGIARSSQVVFLPAVIILFFLFVLLIPDVNLENLLPVFEDGAANILRSSITPLAWVGEIMFVVFLAPSINKISKTAKYSVITIALIGFGGFVNELFYTGVFGLLRQHFANPFYSLIRYIKPTAFIERYDILFVTINLLGNFVKLSVFLYIFVLCLSQWLGMKSHRPLVLPSSVALLICTQYFVSSSNELILFLDTVFPLYTIPILYGIPALVLLVAVIRGIKG
ncbi:MAG TPA: endospore germination permease [Clostridia bacterium]|nr:endospore germination permease [Clostridia bacterium]